MKLNVGTTPMYVQSMSHLSLQFGGKFACNIAE